MIDHFGILSPIYDRLIRSSDPKRLLDLLELPPDGKLLDAGGGTGRIGYLLRPYVSQVVIADINFRMLKQAQNKADLYPVCTPSERLPFPGNSFDRVIMVDALHHVHDTFLTAKELWRVTKPYGRIIIEEPDIRAFSVKLVALFEKLALMRSHFSSPKKITELFSFTDEQPVIHENGYTVWVVINKSNSI